MAGWDLVAPFAAGYCVGGMITAILVLTLVSRRSDEPPLLPYPEEAPQRLAGLGQDARLPMSRRSTEADPVNHHRL
ncbi:MAG: hypothetical protein QOJ92_607 [Frankiales bacterium]|nr:hypothetical protein [Frankiales bacterium]